MLGFLVIFAVVGTISLVPPADSYVIDEQDWLYDLDEVEDLFEDFIETYQRQYTSEHEKEMRFDIFKANLFDVNKKNVKHGTQIYGINKFSDRTKEEFRSSSLGFNPSKMSLFADEFCPNKTADDDNAPDSWDWREQNKVSAVKDQAICGSCWAFSAIGNIESQYLIKHGEELDLAEQQLVDCDKNSKGCQGTEYIGAPFKDLIETGVERESDYPYMASDGTCRYDKRKTIARVKSCTTFIADEEKLKSVLRNHGPLSIGVAAEHWAHYDKGIVKYCSGETDHVVLLVGYGVEDGIPYWVIKNSWGPNWGENGFIRLRRGVNACNLTNIGAIAAEVA